MIIQSGTQVTFQSRAGVEVIGDVVRSIDDDLYHVVDDTGMIHEVPKNELEEVD